MWMYDEDDDYYLTPEEQNDRYLRDNPALESMLWAEWVEVVCDRERVARPSSEEWATLRSKFYHGKAPIDSVIELKKMRVQ